VNQFAYYKSADENRIKSLFCWVKPPFSLLIQLGPGRGSEPLGRCPMCGVDASCAGVAQVVGGQQTTVAQGVGFQHGKWTLNQKKIQTSDLYIYI
jgi:hypothetical protein